MTEETSAAEVLRYIHEALHDLDPASVLGLLVRHDDREMQLCWPFGDDACPGSEKWRATCEVDVEFDGVRTAYGEGDSPLEALEACATEADGLDDEGASIRPVRSERPLNVQVPAGVGVAELAANEGEVERLDLSKPPPGYRVYLSTDIWYARDDHGVLVDAFRDDDGASTVALAAAQDDYQARHDPPGMALFVDLLPEPTSGKVPLGDTRATAWRWYLRRLVLVDRLERGGHACEGTEDEATPCAACNLWPRALTWSDDQCEQVETWLVDSTAELPEVLRG